MPEFTAPSPEDQFADALDAMALGLPVPGAEDMSLADAARTIGVLGAPINDDFDNPPVPLDRATKRRIWADLMREHGGSTEPSPVPQSPGAAGSTLAPNPWVARRNAKPKRPRPSTGVLRFVPAAQPASTFMLVVAVLALVGGAFASLGPNGGQGILPTALATADPSQLASASPEASPGPYACVVDPPADASGEPLPSRLYRTSVNGVPELHEYYVSNRWEQIVTCGGLAGAGEIPSALMTDHRAADEATAWIVTADEAGAILGYPPAWHELNDLEALYAAILDANPGPISDPLALDAGLGVYRALADGRIVFYSGVYWLAEDGRIDPATDPAAGTRVTVHIFAQEDRQWLYDESLVLCIGMCTGFEASGAPKPQLTVATPAAADRQWLAPLTGETCVLATPEAPAASPTVPSVETDPADYVPFATADAADRVAAATTYLRITSGCEASADQPLAAEGNEVILGIPGEPWTTQSQIDTAHAITAALGTTDPIEILIANDEALEIVDEDGFTYIQKYFVLLPDDVVHLPDGRLGGMLRVQQVSNMPGVWDRFGGVTTLFVTFDKVGGEWAMAESFFICVGQCDDLWSEAASLEANEPAVATSTSSLAASPVATKP